MTFKLTIDKADISPSKVEVKGNKTFTLTLTTALHGGQTVDVVQQDQTSRDMGEVTVADLADTSAATPTSSLFTLALVGVNASGASSSSVTQQYFVSFDVTSPIGSCGGGKVIRYTLERRCWVWVNPRIASIPTTSTSDLSTLSSPSSLSTGTSKQSIGSITQSFELQAGFEYRFGNPWKGNQFGANKSYARTSLGGIIGGGFSTPFDTSAPNVQYSLNSNLAAQFQQNPQLAKTYPILASCLTNYGYSPDNDPVTCPASLATDPTTGKPKSPAVVPSSVAFVLPNRSRFYRDYYFGLRLRTFYLSGDCPDPSTTLSQKNCKLENTFPGTFDVRFGQDETVTAGSLHGWVMTLSGTYPLPGTSGTVRIFGSVYLGLGKNKVSNPLVLVPASTVATLDMSTVVIQPIQPSNQDYFRLGLGVDLVPLISKWVSAASK